MPLIDCGPVVNNTLTSPGYPSNYPRNKYCESSVSVPDAMALIIDFQDFDVQPGRHGSCGFVKSTYWQLYCPGNIIFIMSETCIRRFRL